MIQPFISVIIPTLNEAVNIASLISFLRSSSLTQEYEIIVADGGSSDNTVLLSNSLGVKTIVCNDAGRASQMNAGARIAKGNILYFIHADTCPPDNWMKDISEAIEDGYKLGRYKTRFNSPSILLKVNAFFTNFDFAFCHGGDQTLFITIDLFNKIKGFNASLKIMEDYDVVERARKFGKYAVLRGSVLISARKYESNSWLKVQMAHLKIIRMYRNGASQNDIIKKYNKLITYR